MIFFLKKHSIFKKHFVKNWIPTTGLCYLFLCLFQLFDETILKISRKLIEKAEILELGHRLGIGSDTMDINFVKYQNDLTEATRQILRVWLHRQHSLQDARVKLGRALVDCEKNLMAGKILNFPP